MLFTNTTTIFYLLSKIKPQCGVLKTGLVLTLRSLKLNQGQILTTLVKVLIVARLVMSKILNYLFLRNIFDLNFFHLKTSKKRLENKKIQEFKQV
jgi:hypothetical protein